MRRISVIGYFGNRSEKLDGQTVKTRMVYRLLNEHVGNIGYYDSEEFQFNKLSIFSMFMLAAKSSHIIYLPAHNNLKFIFPFIWAISKLCHAKISYLVIGGWLSKFIKPLQLHRFMLKRIDGLYTETERLQNELTEWYGMKNVHLMRNFRYIDFTPTEHHTQGKLKLVYMARIMKAKGIPMIFELGDFLKEHRLTEAVSVDFYGQIESEDEAYFKENIMQHPSMTYKGVLMPDDIHKTLEKYDMMILPTHYPGEGLPGSLIDSYISGLPIIVTEWAYAHEFVTDGETGIIIPYTDGQKELNDAVVNMLNDEELLHRMKTNARKRCHEFSAENAWEKMETFL